MTSSVLLASLKKMPSRFTSYTNTLTSLFRKESNLQKSDSSSIEEPIKVIFHTKLNLSFMSSSEKIESTINENMLLKSISFNLELDKDEEKKILEKENIKLKEDFKSFPFLSLL